MFITGINPTQTWESTETPPFAAGTVGAVGSRVYQFVKMDSGGTTGAGYVVAIEGVSDGDMVDTTVSTPGTSVGVRLGVAMAAIPASGYGWLCIFGDAVSIRVAASCVKGTQLNTTGTAGQLDDDATAGSEVAEGIVITTTATSAGNYAGVVTWPRIGRTL